MLGTGELIIILCLILFLFGGKKLPEFARNLGKGIHEFRKACEGKCDTESDPPIGKSKEIEVEINKDS